jgi:pimeloyl-ACP methyl ester carboxylesterase
MSEFAPTRLTTPRLTMNVWSAGPEDGRPVLLVHGNLSSGGFWRYVASELPDDVRVIAPDLRGYGDTDPEPIDATRGLGDHVGDLRGLVEILGLAGRRSLCAVGWSMGAGVLQQWMLEHPDDLGSVVLVAPLSPYGFGGTKADGSLCFPDAAASGAGAVNADFVARLAAKDSSEDQPMTSPRIVMRTLFGSGRNAANVDEDFLVGELLKIRTGEDHYPGDSVPSEYWPGSAPGSRGILNTMTPNRFNASGIVDLPAKPPITWIQGGKDQVVSDASLSDLATLGQLGAVPGWPGAEVLPPQPMISQMRAVLGRYRAAGGEVREVLLDDEDHGIPLAVPGLVAAEIIRRLT